VLLKTTLDDSTRKDDSSRRFNRLKGLHQERGPSALKTLRTCKNPAQILQAAFFQSLNNGDGGESSLVAVPEEAAAAVVGATIILDGQKQQHSPPPAPALKNCIPKSVVEAAARKLLNSAKEACTNPSSSSSSSGTLEETTPAEKEKTVFQTLPKKLRANSKIMVFRSEKVLLPKYFEPGPYTVMMGCREQRNGFRNSIGNLTLNEVCRCYVNKYSVGNLVERGQIVTTVLELMYSYSPIGAFVRCQDGRYFEVEDVVAREKIGSDLRNFLPEKYTSASANRRAARIKRNKALKKAAALLPDI
jgi:hypothetical protein